MNRPHSKLPIPQRTLLALLASAIVLAAFMLPDDEDYFYKVNTQLEVFGETYRELSRSYVDRLDPEEMITAAIDGMLEELDPYTEYLQKEEAGEIELLSSGSYGGIGVSVGMRDSMVTITDVMDGYSAQREGIRIGDRIMDINGVRMLNGPIERLREQTRGLPNTTVPITIQRDGVDTLLRFVLTREAIRVRSISHSGMVGDSVGYVRLTRFSTNAGDEMRAAILDLQRQGMERGLILDLRDNPGGVLEAAVDVVAKFVPSGSLIVSTRGRDTAESEEYRSTEEPIAQGLPVVVMVDGYSASAAEIVAGAMQDLDVGVVMGQPSFGKGLVQSTRLLPDDNMLKMTTARYYTPSGRCIQKIDYTNQRVGRSLDTSHRLFRTRSGRPVYDHGGVQPDTLVRLPDTAAIIVRLLESNLFFRFASQFASGMRTLPERFAVSDSLLQAFFQFSTQELNESEAPDPLIDNLNQLHDAARRTRRSTQVIEQIEKLRSIAKADQKNEMERHREQLRHWLNDEIAARFTSQRERAIKAIPDDRQITAAIGLLRSGGKVYRRLLAVK
ncbi:MAG: S41 family peptidase [Armatimonadetes bacterium]|nr:S41 family peptidase [Armatimonadota bacterium]